MSDAILIRGVTKTFGSKAAVKDLDLAIPTGTVCGFIGPNGAGKTTTIRMIMSIIFPDSGEISVLGKASAVESKDRIGYLPEERGVYRKMRVGAFLTYMGRLKGVDSAGLDAKIRNWLARVGLADCHRKKCEELSKGMQQKVQFITAVLHEPELIILDEPFSGLDPVNRKLLRDLIDEQSQAGRTVIFSTHAMYEAEQLCDRVFMIHRGRKVLDGPLDDIWKKYDPRVVYAELTSHIDDHTAETARAIAGVVEAAAVARGLEVRLGADVPAGPVMSELARLLPVRKVELKRPNLDDIFIQLVGGSDAAIRAELSQLDDGKQLDTQEASA